MRTIRFTNGQIQRLRPAYNTGLFIHKITYLPAAVPPKNSSGLAQNVKIRLLINDHIYNLSMTAIFKKSEKKITLMAEKSPQRTKTLENVDKYAENFLRQS